MRFYKEQVIGYEHGVAMTSQKEEISEKEYNDIRYNCDYKFDRNAKKIYFINNVKYYVYSSSMKNKQV